MFSAEVGASGAVAGYVSGCFSPLGRRPSGRLRDHSPRTARPFYHPLPPKNALRRTSGTWVISARVLNRIALSRVVSAVF